MRLDIYLTKNFNIQSRNKALELIRSNKIRCNGEIISKGSFKVEEDTKIEILEDNLYVSRAAYKLKYFLEELKQSVEFNLKDKTALDIGSSTGGFTQILLENDVKSVTCVDVGSNQLHEKLKDDTKIDFYEKTDIRDFKKSVTFDVITCDVSFISVTNLFEYINNLAKKDIIILFKPQFEVGIKVKRDKKGVVRDNLAIQRARDNFLIMAQKQSWILKYSGLSQLRGKDGNEEELFYFSK